MINNNGYLGFVKIRIFKILALIGIFIEYDLSL